ncbi:MAG: FAD-dependent oxidoreductase [Gammaproteobacteria bacterium]|nr:FAD-dependent oxidoreductase [Gammaproteobacteria bacterium]MDJ0889598.1 FAD-dependent oxidoreductase [Gammaproteobacteria bacterium]
MARHRYVVAGAGFAGITLANQLERAARKHGVYLEITLIGQKEKILYQPGLLFAPFGKRGYRNEADLTWPVRRFLRRGIHFVRDKIVAFERDAKEVITESRGRFSYDTLVVALGTRLAVSDDEVYGLA